MKHFAKYLPVEGEIKKGDYCTSLYGVVVKLGVNEIPWPNSKKVKLFLCSRDVKVGDRIWSDEYKELKEYRYTESLDFSNNPIPSYSGAPSNKTFKVIGEVSPEATWVKEGDEFEEDEIRIVKIPWGRFHTKEKIQIKGPCGHFH